MEVFIPFLEVVYFFKQIQCKERLKIERKTTKSYKQSIQSKMFAPEECHMIAAFLFCMLPF